MWIHIRTGDKEKVKHMRSPYKWNNNDGKQINAKEMGKMPPVYSSLYDIRGAQHYSGRTGVYTNMYQPYLFSDIIRFCQQRWILISFSLCVIIQKRGIDFHSTYCKINRMFWKFCCGSFRSSRVKCIVWLNESLNVSFTNSNWIFFRFIYCQTQCFFYEIHPTDDFATNISYVFLCLFGSLFSWPRKEQQYYFLFCFSAQQLLLSSAVKQKLEKSVIPNKCLTNEVNTNV